MIYGLVPHRGEPRVGGANARMDHCDGQAALYYPTEAGELNQRRDRGACSCGRWWFDPGSVNYPSATWPSLGRRGSATHPQPPSQSRPGRAGAVRVPRGSGVGGSVIL